MTRHEKEALLRYLEFHLVSLADDLEPHLAGEAVGHMYDRAYGILNDIEHTLDTQADLDAPKTSSSTGR